MAAGADIERGREAYAGGAWKDVYDSLSRADEIAGLEAEDLELLATSAYMLGREADYFRALERAYRAFLDGGQRVRAVRAALWIGINLAQRGEMGRAGGWLGRARRLLEREEEDCAERGYLLLPAAFEREARGDWEGAAEIVAEAAAMGDRLGDPDLFALAVHEQGHVLIQHGRVREGLALLDEAMVAVTTVDLSPIVTGIVYCGVILACRDAYEVGRAREWTAALTRWCETQPEMVAFTGRCLVHRAEVLELGGAWGEALEEAGRAVSRALQGGNARAAAEARYRAGEIHRRRGELDAAEEAYREASRRGREPQPGLALLRLAQGDADAAAGAVRRALAETSESPARAQLLPAQVEIMLEAGDLEAARGACGELERIAAEHGSGVLAGMAAYARGRVDLALGQTRPALAALRRASELWQELDAPYEAARARVLIGLACGSLGDGDSAAMELDAARDVFASLGAAPDLASVDALRAGEDGGEAHGLSPRELEVLRLVASGLTNRAIAEELVLSERTVDRHVSNILAKLRVSSRAAATAYAYEHRLL